MRLLACIGCVIGNELEVRRNALLPCAKLRDLKVYSDKMKYVIIVPDGCADEPIPSLSGQTPLAVARTPAMDQIARLGVVGRANHAPESLPVGSDSANMSVLGYNPVEFYRGRAPLEAAAQGISLGSDDWALRCNLVCIQNGVMRDFTAGHISTEEARLIIETLNAELPKRCHLDDSKLTFYPGVSYRNLLVLRTDASSPYSFTMAFQATPPHDRMDQTILDSYPRGAGCDMVCQMMEASGEILANHPVNVKRLAEGKLPATHIWLWGLGCSPILKPFAQLHGLTGAMITAVDLLRGIAELIGWRRVEVPNVTGYLDTNFVGKGQAAIDALREVDVVCIHVEAPDETSHQGNLHGKIESLEKIDELIVRPVHDALRQKYADSYRILVQPDHLTPIRTKTHAHGDIPFTMCGTGIQSDSSIAYSEATAANSTLQFPEGWRLLYHFLLHS